MSDCSREAAAGVVPSVLGCKNKNVSESVGLCSVLYALLIVYYNYR